MTFVQTNDIERGREKWVLNAYVKSLQQNLRFFGNLIRLFCAMPEQVMLFPTF